MTVKVLLGGCVSVACFLSMSTFDWLSSVGKHIVHLCIKTCLKFNPSLNSGLVHFTYKISLCLTASKNLMQYIGFRRIS